MDFYNNKRLHGSLDRKSPLDRWNEYYGSFPADMQQKVQVSEELSRVEASADTCLALDKYGDMATFADQPVNENDKLILNSFNEIVQFIGG
jgi:hypothetical protein